MKVSEIENKQQIDSVPFLSLLLTESKLWVTFVYHL